MLNTRQTRVLVEQNGVVMIQADWTDRDPEVTKMLEILGGKQVPVLRFFPPAIRTARLSSAAATLSRCCWMR